MKRIDWVVLRRLSGTVFVSMGVMFGLFILLESLDYHRFVYLSEVGGPPLAILSMVAGASRWSIRTMSVTMLGGSILGILDLQIRQELNIIRASGASIWQVVRAPVIAALLLGLVVAVFFESFSAQLDRSINPTQATNTGAVTSDGALWLEQDGAAAGRYVLRAGRVQPGAAVLNDVTIFLDDEYRHSRIITPEARLLSGAWLIAEGIGYRAGLTPGPIENLQLPTSTTPTDLQVRLASTDDLTFLELATVLFGRISDPILHNAVLTRFMRLASMPLMMMGSVLIAFAFTAGYRRANNYGSAVLYGIVLGFVVFFITEMADRAGSAGALHPTFAAAGPAAVAILVGLTVLLYREDGRA